MDPFVVHEEVVDGPATHALLVGVGRYTHLIGGDGITYNEHGGMGQLSSPPLSALAFAEWLAESYHHPDKPLASVALLASGAGDVEFQHPATGAVAAVEAPTFARLEQAAKEWKARGDTNPDNLMLFYFCGHGIANGPDLSLILQDFGEDPDAALESALDFRRFHLGMERCRARQQCFFIDACRVADSNIVDAAGYAGRPIFTPSTRRDRTLPLRMKPVFYSTFAGTSAQARMGEVSLFTDAVLRAFNGGGADDMTGVWWIDTNQLQKAVQFMMERAHQQGFPSIQINPADDMSTFALHCLDAEPAVPVVVGCLPKEHNLEATLTWQGEGAGDERPPTAEDWDLELRCGDYTFGAALAAGAPVPEPKQRLVRPPYQIVHLEVHQ